VTVSQPQDDGIYRASTASRGKDVESIAEAVL